MKTLKFFLMTSFILLLLATGVVGYVWFKLQGPSLSQTESTSHETQSATDTSEGLRIDTNALTDEQKAVAKKVGINLDTLVVTQEMIACAEEKLGADRIQEIITGDTPSARESVSLLGCL